MEQISGEIIRELLPILRPFMWDKQQRRAYLIKALGTDSPVLNLLEWDQPVDVFIPNLVNQLVNFGEIFPEKAALCVLLEVISEDVGEDVKLRINGLLQNIREEFKKAKDSQEIRNKIYVNESPNPFIKNSLTRTFTTSTYLDDWNQLETELNNWLSQNSSSVIIKNIQAEYIYTKGAKVSVDFLVREIIDNTKPYLKARIFHGLHDSIVYTNIYKHSETKVESWNSNVASLLLGFGAFAVVIFQPN